MRRSRVLLAGLVAGLSLLTACNAGPPRSSAAPGASPASPAPSRAGTPPPSAPAAQKLRWTSCHDGFACATLTVPLDEAHPDGRTVALAVVRHRATGPGPRIGSLLVNPGGPGASAVDYLRGAYSGLPKAVRARFDVVAFDPRGVGHSAPVHCGTTAQLDRYFALDPSPDDAAGLAAYEKANAALTDGCESRSGAELPFVSTPLAAGDMERLRASLGDARLTYLGYSYGTSIGAAYLDRFPTHVRAMVLDGALDPSLTWDALLEGQSRGFDAAFRSFLADCDRTRCAFRKAVPGDLGAAYDRLAATVAEKPLRTDTSRTVGPGLFSYGVSAALYSRDDWPALAQGLSDAERGNGDLLLALSDSYLERGDQGYTNVSEANVAVNCLDRPWPHDPAPYLALARKVEADSPRFGPSIALSGLSCATWPVPPAATPHRVTAPGAPPVLVIGTTGDPATPYAWAVALAGQLSSGVLLTHVGDGHTVYRATAPACITGPVDTYLITGRAPAPARC